jgi:hypothetical protein
MTHIESMEMKNAQKHIHLISTFIQRNDDDCLDYSRGKCLD